MRPGLSATVVLSSVLIVSLVVVPAGAGKPVAPATPPNIDISQRHTNESEEAVAVNPTNPQNIVMVSNVDFRLPGCWKA